jgi:hypothetical protein
MVEFASGVLRSVPTMLGHPSVRPRWNTLHNAVWLPKSEVDQERRSPTHNNASCLSASRNENCYY